MIHQSATRCSSGLILLFFPHCLFVYWTRLVPTDSYCEGYYLLFGHQGHDATVRPYLKSILIYTLVNGEGIEVWDTAQYRHIQHSSHELLTYIIEAPTNIRQLVSGNCSFRWAFILLRNTIMYNNVINICCYFKFMFHLLCSSTSLYHR